MPDDTNVAKARCVHCREEIQVPSRYAHGDHIRCGTCSTDHRVVRGGERLRLVLADAGPLRDALAKQQQQQRRLESDLAQARASFGVGVNGIGVGVAFAVYRIAIGGAVIDASLLWASLGIAIVSGLLLEGANWAFLAKRSAIARLTQELKESRAEAARLRAQIRETGRV